MSTKIQLYGGHKYSVLYGVCTVLRTGVTFAGRSISRRQQYLSTLLSDPVIQSSSHYSVHSPPSYPAFSCKQAYSVFETGHSRKHDSYPDPQGRGFDRPSKRKAVAAAQQEKGQRFAKAHPSKFKFRRNSTYQSVINIDLVSHQFRCGVIAELPRLAASFCPPTRKCFAMAKALLMEYQRRQSEINYVKLLE